MTKSNKPNYSGDSTPLSKDRKLSRVISAFPGTGKSHFYKNSDKKVLDSDSSKFSWIENGVRNPDFPTNYIEHIKKNIGTADYILVSSHKEVRDALVEAGIFFTLIFPTESLKEEYVQRYKNRGSDQKFIELVEANWKQWIDDNRKQPGCDRIEMLEPEMYISDVLTP